MSVNSIQDTTVESDNRDAWRSLFLPLQNAIFTSFITLFSPYHQVDTSVDKEPSEQRTSVSETCMTAGAPEERSPLFALCGERADMMVCVLANHDISFVSMMDGFAGPTEVRRLRGTKDDRKRKNSTATCAALIPPEVAHKCRFPKAAIPMPCSSSSTRPDSGTEVDEYLKSGNTMFLRGVVGSSDGRVDVFSEHCYVFGFIAHDAPVAAVSAIYGVGDDAARSGAERSFGAATAGLGFVTCGTDGVVLLWRSEGLALRPRRLLRPSLFSRRVAWCVVQPTSRDWLLGGMAAPRSSLFLHATPRAPYKLRVRDVPALGDVGPRVPLPGAKFFTRTAATAIAADGAIALVARGRKVYRAALAEGRCNLAVATPKPVAHMQLAPTGIAVAACAGKKSRVLVLDARSMTILASYTSGLAGPVRCVALHPGARLVAMVGGRGDVEVAAMPAAEAEPCGEALVEVTEAIPAARALQCLASLQREGRPQISPEEHAALQEKLAMSRMAMPGAMNHYLHSTAGVS